jgi:hypothetical protein
MLFHPAQLPFNPTAHFYHACLTWRIPSHRLHAVPSVPFWPIRTPTHTHVQNSIFSAGQSNPTWAGQTMARQTAEVVDEMLDHAATSAAATAIKMGLKVTVLVLPEVLAPRLSPKIDHDPFVCTGSFPGK